MERDRLSELDVAEAIVGAPATYKTIRSTVRTRGRRFEYLYVIYGTTLDGLVVYTKGKLSSDARSDFYYFLVSAKRSE